MFFGGGFLLGYNGLCYNPCRGLAVEYTSRFSAQDGEKMYFLKGISLWSFLSQTLCGDEVHLYLDASSG